MPYMFNKSIANNKMLYCVACNCFHMNSAFRVNYHGGDASKACISSSRTSCGVNCVYGCKLPIESLPYDLAIHLWTRPEFISAQREMIHTEERVAAGLLTRAAADEIMCSHRLSVWNAAIRIDKLMN